VIRSEETIAIEIDRRLREIARERGRGESLLVRMHPRVISQFTGNGARLLAALEEETGKRFHFEGSEGLPPEHFDIVLEGTREEVEERALPFREGDEVFVQIVEPHMYNVDDAVAKIDGYIISVVAGGSHVGQRRLVRIDEVGRTAAVATLVDNGADPTAGEAPAGDGAREAADGDDVQSRPRRRGRRGGRRRSRARGPEAPGESGGSAPVGEKT
jgi:ribonuclease G